MYTGAGAVVVGLLAGGFLVAAVAACQPSEPPEPPEKTTDDEVKDKETDADEAESSEDPVAASVQCGDNIKNGGETGIDCGGTCSPCADGSACKVPTDCASSSCVRGLCCSGPSCATADGGRPGAVGRVSLFTDRDLKGQSIVIDGPMENLGDGPFNDHARSLTVEGGTWEVCEHARFGGWCASFSAGSVLDLGPLSNKISSLRPRLASP
jgi:hypothetical protein